MRRLWRRLFRRTPRRVEQCCRCGRDVAGKEIHTVVETFADDAELGIAMGGTGVSAVFCAEHCPGGCDRRH